MSACPSQSATVRKPPALRRWLLASLGLACVALAALGVVIPGLPTTIFLLAASYLFTRSCPYLEERLIRNRFFAPFLGYLDGSVRMPWRARLTAMALMWTFVLISVVTLTLRTPAPIWLIVTIPAAAVVGTAFIARQGRGFPERKSADAAVTPSGPRFDPPPRTPAAPTAEPAAPAR